MYGKSLFVCTHYIFMCMYMCVQVCVMFMHGGVSYALMKACIGEYRCVCVCVHACLCAHVWYDVWWGEEHLQPFAQDVICEDSHL